MRRPGTISSYEQHTCAAGAHEVQTAGERMTAYALGHLRRGPAHPDILEYLERIQGTLDPFGGRFIVHGDEVEVLEGDWPGHLIIIEFPDIDRARGWYASADYQVIKPLRTNHLAGDVLLVDGCEPDHDSAQMAAEMRVASGL